MAVEQARSIVTARETYTWRAVAEWAHSDFAPIWLVDWSMPEHQEVGRLICLVAAEKLGVDPD